ncbi:hypothetical protein J7K06_05920 [Candidatus Bathyarchaeota archaeon]|nr:hypothetical protein [Candidatus Bathyarchaeota archaeon]
MKCPYLSSSSKKICVKMLEMKLNPELTDFDVRNYCEGNPIYCYYFRLPQIEEKLKRQKEKPNSLRKIHVVYRKLPKIKLNVKT